MPFTFSVNTERSFRSLDGVCQENNGLSDRVSFALDVDGDISSTIGAVLPSLLKKWGFAGMQIRSFRFDLISEGDVIFHQGMLKSLIEEFFNDQTTVNHLGIQVCSDFAAGKIVPNFEILNATATSLSLLNRVLHCKSFTRNPPEMPTRSHSSLTNINSVCRYPMIKQMDIFLPSGVTISDTLREYLMLSDDSYSDNKERILDDELEENGPASDDDTDLTFNRSHPLISQEQRREFLFHVFWRLASGGSPLCQFEEDAIFYKMAAREMYKDFVCAGRKSTSGEGSEPEIVVQSFVIEIQDLFAGPTKTRVTLFPMSDGITPSNSNFAYLIVNPSRREIVWWYNAFSSF